MKWDRYYNCTAPIAAIFPYSQQEPFSQDDHDDGFNAQHDDNNEGVTDNPGN